MEGAMAETSPADAAIVFDNVRKDYRLGRSQYPTLKEWVLSLPKRQGPRRFRALDGVSFRVEQGQVLGLIGENGSGKSALLKLIAGISAPTSGSIHVHGRVSSLLEIGTGFHPEMTGRE
ncbi:MAG TPA: ATP-binding cassette domain-containing protein, partial [Firmicutes bacterium]|nr:ATP-binding cassette domain-containing protein [Bacillota bacterium]